MKYVAHVGSIFGIQVAAKNDLFRSIIGMTGRILKINKKSKTKHVTG